MRTFWLNPEEKKKNFHMIQNFYIKGLNATIFDNKLNMHDNYYDGAKICSQSL